MRHIVFALAMTGCFATITGNGEAETEIRNLTPSDAVRLGGFYDATVVTDGDLDVVEVTCDSNLLPFIVTEVVDGELLLHTENGRILQPRADCTLHVKLSQPPTRLSVSGSGSMEALGQLPDLQEARVSGSGELVLADGAGICGLDADVSGSGHLDLGELQGCSVSTRVSGSGSLSATGQVAELDADISGSGHLDLVELSAAFVDASVSGSGDGDVTATTSIRARVSGSGHIRVHGDPEDRDVDVTGSGGVDFL